MVIEFLEQPQKTDVKNRAANIEGCLHQSFITDFQTGEILCENCGFVAHDKLQETGLEFYTNNLGEYLKRTRTGDKIKLRIDDMGLSTVISPSNIDSSGRSLSSDNIKKFSRLRLWDKRSRSRQNNPGMRQAFDLLDAMKTKLAIPERTVERAAYIYRKALSEDIQHGRRTPVLISASLYAACRQTDTPRTLTDIAKAVNIKRKFLSRDYRYLVKIFDLKLKPYEPTEFVSRISSAVGVSEKIRRDALSILYKCIDREISTGKNPIGLAASALYLSCVANGVEIDQKKIVDAACISSVTLRNLCTTILRNKVIQLKSRRKKF